MPREKVKLTVEKTRVAIRYRKMFRGEVWISKHYKTDTRENRREAWNEFVEWRTERKTKPEPETLLHKLLTEKVDPLIEHAELTGSPEEARVSTQIRELIPKATSEELFELTALLLGEYNGQSCKQVIEDRTKTARRLKRQTDANLTARKKADEFIQRFRRKAENGRGSYGRYGQVRTALEYFVTWFGPGRSLEHLTEKTVKDYGEFLELKIGEDWSQTTAHDYQKTFQTFIGSVCEDYPEISMPNNLRSRRLRIPAERKEPVPFTVEEVNLLLEYAVPRMKLFLMLMTNCGFYQGDLADLNAPQVDWNEGRIIRPRSKVEKLSRNGKSEPVKVNWKLWQKTFNLLKEHGSQSGLVFLNENGNPLVYHGLRQNGKEFKNDSVRSAYRRLIDKLKRRTLLPKEWNKTLKQLRKTGANLLEKSQEYGEFYSLYLDSSTVPKKHYLTSGEPVPKFDEAIMWLGRQFKL